MTELKKAEDACAALVEAFAYYVDRHENHFVLDLFATDAQFHRPDASLIGRDAIGSFLATRSKSTTTRHLCQRPFFLEVGAREARATTVFTFYSAPNEGTDIPICEGPRSIGEYDDQFVLTDDGWKIAQRKVAVIMIRRA